jgi:FAD synthase
MVAPSLAPRQATALLDARSVEAMPVAVVRGHVEHGDARGRLLGFPTANLSVDHADVADGVWAALVTVDETGPDIPAAVSIGRRTTFYGRHGHRLLEAHLLDVDMDLYGRLLDVRLYRQLRPQRRFDDVDALVEQMHRDVGNTRDWAHAGSPSGRPAL